MSYLELLEKLRRVDEVTLLELLDVESDDLVDVFIDKIKERSEYIIRCLDEQ